jgi:hypothetical protein
MKRCHYDIRLDDLAQRLLLKDNVAIHAVEFRREFSATGGVRIHLRGDGLPDKYPEGAVLKAWVELQGKLQHCQPRVQEALEQFRVAILHELILANGGNPKAACGDEEACCGS